MDFFCLFYQYFLFSLNFGFLYVKPAEVFLFYSGLFLKGMLFIFFFSAFRLHSLFCNPKEKYSNSFFANNKKKKKKKKKIYIYIYTYVLTLFPNIPFKPFILSYAPKMNGHCFFYFYFSFFSMAKLFAL